MQDVAAPRVWAAQNIGPGPKVEAVLHSCAKDLLDRDTNSNDPLRLTGIGQLIPKFRLLDMLHHQLIHFL